MLLNLLKAYLNVLAKDNRKCERLPDDQLVYFYNQFNALCTCFDITSCTYSHFIFVTQALSLCVCIQQRRISDITTYMIDGYLHDNLLKMEGVVKKRKACVLLHYHCASFPPLYNRNFKIVPSRCGLFLQHVAKVSQTDTNVWECLSNSSNVGQVGLLQTTSTNLGNDMKLLLAECSKQGESKWDCIFLSGNIVTFIFK